MVASRYATAVVLLTLLLGARTGGPAAVPAASGPATRASEAALAPDPAVTAILDKLDSNSSAVLPSTKVIGDVGPLAKEYGMQKRGPGGRDFTIKMAWMPDRKRAFFCGANHGSPHRLNDAWEYDLPSNSWIVLYAADYNDRGEITDYDKQTLVLKDGWLRTKRGGPAHPAHTWWGLTYDPERKAVLWWCSWPGYRLDAKLGAIGATKEQLHKGPPMWTFDPAARKWEPLPTAPPSPPGGLAGSLEYVPDLKGAVWTQPNAGAWLLRSDTAAWRNLSKGTVRPPIETIVCYDTGRRLLIGHRGPLKDGTYRSYHMAVTGPDAGEWKIVLDKPGLPMGHDARSFFYFDPAGKVGLLYEAAERAIWSYEPDKTLWMKLTPNGPPPPEKGDNRTVAYFDVARNVFVVNMGTATWVYRYRR